MLNAIASWLESPNNEALLLSEYDDKCMQVVADSCVLAAAILKNAADEVDHIEPAPASNITSESIEDLAALAHAFDKSGDPSLKKQASVLDELLLTIAAQPNLLANKKAADDSRIEELKKKYQSPRQELFETNKLADVEKGISQSEMTKTYRILEAPLTTRYCPDHPGSQIARIGQNIWQCELDKKQYNYEAGFTLSNGNKVPGGDVSNQTQGLSVPVHAIFDTREGRLGYNKAHSNNENIIKTGMPIEPEILKKIIELKEKINSSKKPTNDLIDELNKINDVALFHHVVRAAEEKFGDDYNHPASAIKHHLDTLSENINKLSKLEHTKKDFPHKVDQCERMVAKIKAFISENPMAVHVVVDEDRDGNFIMADRRFSSLQLRLKLFSELLQFKKGLSPEDKELLKQNLREFGTEKIRKHTPESEESGEEASTSEFEESHEEYSQEKAERIGGAYGRQQQYLEQQRSDSQKFRDLIDTTINEDI